MDLMVVEENCEKSEVILNEILEFIGKTKNVVIEILSLLINLMLHLQN